MQDTIERALQLRELLKDHEALALALSSQNLETIQLIKDWVTNIEKRLLKN